MRARLGELERERDVRRAERVLHELRHLGRLRARDRVDLRAGVAQDARGVLEALLADATDDARGRLLGVGLDARVDPLGGEGDEHVLAGDETAAGERLDEHPAGRADRRRRGEDDRLARAGVVDDRVAGAAQGAEVRLAALVDRRRDRDDDRVGGGEVGRVGGQRERAVVEVAGELELFVVEELGVARGDGRQAARGDVEPDDGVAGDAERDRGRQADVAHADDGDAEVGGGRPGVGACQLGGGGNWVHGVWDGGSGAVRVRGRATCGGCGRGAQPRTPRWGCEECAVRLGGRRRASRAAGPAEVGGTVRTWPELYRCSLASRMFARLGQTGHRAGRARGATCRSQSARWGTAGGDPASRRPVD